MTAMVTKGGEYWEPTQEKVLDWQRSYPAVDVYQELNAMHSWLEDNPTKRKTVRGMPRFCNSWLARAQQSGGRSPFAPEKKERISTRDIPFNDMLTDRSWAE